MDELARVLRRVLLEGPPLGLAVLFGSRARGPGHAHSDVDVAIVPVDLALPLSQELDLQARLGDACHAEVDLVRLDRADTILRRNVARDGRLLVEERAGTFARFQAEAMLEYIDLEPLLEDGKRRFLRRLAAGAK